MIDRILAGDEDAWRAFIAEHEGRLRAYFRPRVPDAATVDDLTQETLIGFYTGLPNFDRTRPPGPMLRTIAAHKLTDWLRRQGRRPSLPVDFSGSSAGRVADGGRAVSSLARSVERQAIEEHTIARVLGSLLQTWRSRGAVERLSVVELTLLAGWTNRDAAARLRLDEQTVANHKSYALRMLREGLAAAGLGDVVG